MGDVVLWAAHHLTSGEPLSKSPWGGKGQGAKLEPGCTALPQLHSPHHLFPSPLPPRLTVLLPEAPGANLGSQQHWRMEGRVLARAAENAAALRALSEGDVHPELGLAHLAHHQLTLRAGDRRGPTEQCWQRREKKGPLHPTPRKLTNRHTETQTDPQPASLTSKERCTHMGQAHRRQTFIRNIFCMSLKHTYTNMAPAQYWLQGLKYQNIALFLLREL